MNAKQYWLLKTEGDVYPIEQLQKDMRTPWTGVRNFQARNFMRDRMRMGDLCLFYHSSSKHNGVYGIAKVASKPYPDPTQFDAKSEYFEPKASKEQPYWWLVDIAFEKQFRTPLLAEAMKSEAALHDMVLWRAGRLSIQPVTPQEFRRIIALCER